MNKFIEMVKKRKEMGATGAVKTIESKRAMLRALQPEVPEPPEEEEEVEDEVYTIEQHGKQIEFKLGAACQVLYGKQTILRKYALQWLEIEKEPWR